MRESSFVTCAKNVKANVGKKRGGMAILAVMLACSALAHDVTVEVRSGHQLWYYPAVGARVSIDAMPPQETAGEPYFAAHAFVGLAEGNHVFTAYPAAGEGGLTSSAMVYVDADLSLILRLTRVSFYARDDTGRPVPGALVTVTPGPLVAMTNDAGVCYLWLADEVGYWAVADVGPLSRSGGFDVGPVGLENSLGELATDVLGANDVLFDVFPAP